MKKSLFTIAAAFAVVAALFSSCKPDENKVVYSDVPFDAVTLTVGEETVAGVIDGTNVTFSFDEAEDFSAATIAFTINNGWTCTWPTSLEDVDLTVDENLVLQFTSPFNAIVKYYIGFTSNSLPIFDASKIKVKNAESAVVELNNAAKKLTVYFNAETMNESAIELVFEEGALAEGATVENPVFDFSASLTQELVITLEGGGSNLYSQA